MCTEKGLDGRYATRRCSRLLLEDAAGSLTRCLSRLTINEQIEQHRTQPIPFGNAERLVRQQIFSNCPEIGVVGPHHNGHTELRRLQRIVTSRWNQTPTNKRHGCQ